MRGPPPVAALGDAALRQSSCAPCAAATAGAAAAGAGLPLVVLRSRFWPDTPIDAPPATPRAMEHRAKDARHKPVSTILSSRLASHGPTTSQLLVAVGRIVGDPPVVRCR